MFRSISSFRLSHFHESLCATFQREFIITINFDCKKHVTGRIKDNSLSSNALMAKYSTQSRKVFARRYSRNIRRTMYT